MSDEPPAHSDENPSSDKEQDKVGSNHEQVHEANQPRIPEPNSGPVERHAETTLEGRTTQHSSRSVDPNRPIPPSFIEGDQGELISIEAVQAMWQGALPHPSDFREYEITLPGAANRIVTMAEESNAVRNASMQKAVDAEISYARSGQVMAFSIAGFSLIAAVIFFALGKNFAGAAFVSFPLVLMIRSFLTGKPDPANEN